MVRLNTEYVHSLIEPSLSDDDKHKIMHMDLDYLSLLHIKNRTLKRIVEGINKDFNFQGDHVLAFDFD